MKGGSLSLLRSRVVANVTGLYLSSLRLGSAILLDSNGFIGNTEYGVLNDSLYAVDASGNWWGDPSGPYPLGTGGAAHDIFSNLEVCPWLDYDPTDGGLEVTVGVSPGFNIFLEINADVSSTSPIREVKFYADGHLLGAAQQPPYTFAWLPRVHLDVVDYYPNTFSSRTIGVVVSDAAGRIRQSSAQSVQEPFFRLPVPGDSGYTSSTSHVESIWQYFDLDRDEGTKRDWLGGLRTYDQHTGTDYGWEEGAPVLAARDGVLRRVERSRPDDPNPDGAWGNFVALEHVGDDGQLYRTYYCHLIAQSIPTWLEVPSEGELQVSEGTQIGCVGRSGKTFGAHLHFEVRVGSFSSNQYSVCPYEEGLIEGPVEFD